MKLVIELVPRPTWEWNLRSELTPKQWDALRKQVYAAAGHRCEVCGGKGSRHPVECHERWVYDETQDPAVQTLEGLEALCPKCHMVRHIGLSIQRGMGPVVIAHMARINGIVEDQVHLLIAQAMRVWERRSARSWVLDLTWLRSQPLV